MAKSYTAEEITAAGLLALQTRDANDELANKKAVEEETARKKREAERKREDDTDDEELDDLKGAGKEALRKERKFRRDAERKAQDFEIERDRAVTDLKTATTKQATSEGNYEALYKAEKEKNETLATAQAADVAKTLREKVAAEYKLPVEMAVRLIGKDEVELKVDAEKLAKNIKPADSAPNTETNTGGTQNGTGSTRDAKDPAKANFSFMPQGGVPIPD